MGKTLNNPEAVTGFYRVVLTCWDFGETAPYADDLSGIELSLFKTEEDARIAVRKQLENEVESLNGIVSMPEEKVPVTDSNGNIVRYEYPYTFEFAGENCGYVRLWNGNEYQIVSAYTIHPVVCDYAVLDKCSYYKYRGFWIVPSGSRNWFKVQQFDTTLFRLRSLEAAFREIDDFLIAFEHGKLNNKKESEVQ